MRGTGASEGINTDEYMPQEQEDGYDAIEWCARSPGATATSRCSALLRRLRRSRWRPTSRRTSSIIPRYSTDDRYTDDCHYRGGLFRFYYDFGFYGAWMIALNAMPPYPEFSGTIWAAIWEQHLEQTRPIC